MAVGGSQSRILHLGSGVGVCRHHGTGLTQLNVVQVQQVAVVGRSLHNIVHGPHRHQAARHDAQAQQGGNGPAQKFEHRMLAFFPRFLRGAALFGGLCFPAAVAHIHFTSLCGLRFLTRIPAVDLSCLIVRDKDRLLTCSIFYYPLSQSPAALPAVLPLPPARHLPPTGEGPFYQIWLV